MIKNAEWGALAYLTHSRYGSNGDSLLAMNRTWAEASKSVGGVTSFYTVANNAVWLQSTTGNASGVYDLIGGANELMALSVHPSKVSTTVAANYRENLEPYWNYIMNPPAQTTATLTPDPAISQSLSKGMAWIGGAGGEPNTVTSYTTWQGKNGESTSIAQYQLYRGWLISSTGNYQTTSLNTGLFSTDDSPYIALHSTTRLILI
jgi:hypothetical protein